VFGGEALNDPVAIWMVMEPSKRTVIKINIDSLSSPRKRCRTKPQVLPLAKDARGGGSGASSSR